MDNKVTLGGDRLGSGQKQKVELSHYNRSTHDLGYTWRSTMASGTLVPFMSEIALRGDSFDIDLNADVLTHPTIGPLFGSYKIQLDVFQVPLRLYIKELHNNALKIGLKMKDLYIPQVELIGNNPVETESIDNQQINPSCLFSYLNVRGIGGIPDDDYTLPYVRRRFNAIPYLAYWDIYKNYYANKAEEIGYVIHNNFTPNEVDVKNVIWYFPGESYELDESVDGTPTIQHNGTLGGNYIVLKMNNFTEFNLNRFNIWLNGRYYKAEELFGQWAFNASDNSLTGSTFILQGQGNMFGWEIGTYNISNYVENGNDIEPQLVEFPLENIDLMRNQLLDHEALGAPYVLNSDDLTPYSLPLKFTDIDDKRYWSLTANQEGLGIKTYQSDLFNNWMNTEWLDGAGGINEITAIDTSNNSVTVNEIILQKKVYDMLNRIAVSGGTYNDYLNSVYEFEDYLVIESPMYIGGLSKELVFEEVVSNAKSDDQPLGTLAGRGRVGSKHKGGSIKVRVKEPSYIIGIISLTPRIDYSQGNKWDMNLKTMDDFHKPALGEIGFQDLITDQMAWFDTKADAQDITYKSAGKVPAWINYMTNVDVVRGNFAEENEQMFMVLNRRYEVDFYNEGDTGSRTRIKDLTTYIDPSKFNHIFAYTRRDAQNFWSQIKVDIIKRSLMSAKVMPNL